MTKHTYKCYNKHCSGYLKPVLLDCSLDYMMAYSAYPARCSRCEVVLEYEGPVEVQNESNR